MYRKVAVLVKNNRGIFKKSFTLYYNGGEIWIEHLDAISNESDLKQKFIQDMLQIKRPSTSSFIAINLDESDVTDKTLKFILDELCSINKIVKVAFVGLDSVMKRYVRLQKVRLNFVINFIDDFEKAKHWLLCGKY